MGPRMTTLSRTNRKLTAKKLSNKGGYSGVQTLCEVFIILKKVFSGDISSSKKVKSG